MTKMEELLSHIEGPVIKGRPVYDLRFCLECLNDQDLHWMLEMYQNGNGSYNTGNKSTTSNPQIIDTHNDDAVASRVSRSDMVELLVSYINNSDTVKLMIKAEELTGFHFIQSTVAAIRRTGGLWAKETASGSPNQISEIEQLRHELHDLDISSHTYYQQYEGQFKTGEEYEADRNRHYDEISIKIAACNKRLDELGYHDTSNVKYESAKVSLVLNSEVDAHFMTLQQAGLIFLFTDWDGKGRESGYHFDLDVNWSVLPKRERDDPWSGIYNVGRAVYNSRRLYDRLIGSQPFKPRQVIRGGVKTWTTEPPRGKTAPSVEDDVCLRLVVPVEIQKIVWNTVFAKEGIMS